MMAIGGKRLKGAVVLIIIAMTVYGVKYASQSLQKRRDGLSYTVNQPNSLIVELAGDTDRSGVYILKKHAIVSDLIMSAGLKKDDYSQDDVSAGLHRGDKVIIDRSIDRRHSAIRIEVMAASNRYVLDMAMDINNAAADDLQLIPGIGKRCSENIIKMRERIGGFRTVDELKSIPALSGKKYEKIKRYFFIREQASVIRKESSDSRSVFG